ncbi:MAG: roadblock/LC7 domain-containing protein [Planctomycetota bacterium]|nr:roadblock/LC7 domain-containing protein [Planctomycetota bacterium]
MRAILTQLNKVQGVRGSMVINRDGIVVAGEFADDVNEQGIGAVASSLLTALDGAVKRINLGRMTRFVLTGNENKAVIVDTGPALLFVLLQRDTNMGLVNVEIRDAAKQVVEQAKM